MAERPTGGTDFDAAVTELISIEALQSPDRVLELLKSGPREIAAQQAKSLWEYAVGQSALADLETSLGRGGSDWHQQGWASLEASLGEMLGESFAAANLGPAFAAFRKATRAKVVLPDLSNRIRRLEVKLARQGALLDFHFGDEKNAYRRRERELSKIISSQSVTGEARTAAARKLLDEISRYRGIYVTRLQVLTAEITEIENECHDLIRLFFESDPLDVLRWDELTNVTLASRRAAVDLVELMLTLEGVLSNDLVLDRLRAVEGQEAPVLSEDAMTVLREGIPKNQQLLEQIKAGKALEEERAEITKRLLGDTPEHQTPPPRKEDAAEINLNGPHPLERKAWYRLAKVLWYLALALWGAFSWIAFPSSDVAVEAALIGAAVLLALRVTVLYVVLGRWTVRERPGSGFIDLDVFEEQLLSSGRGDITESNRRSLQDLRKLYGRRVPAKALQEFIDRQLSNAAALRRRILKEADSKGSTLSMSSLRESMASAPHAAPAAVYDSLCERLLVRLEVEHGPQIPLSVLDTIIETELEGAASGQSA